MTGLPLEPCTHLEPPGPICGVLTAREYGTGPRCPAHTPAAVGGRPEPGQTAYGDTLRATNRQTWPEPREYGQATTDPLGRTGWNKSAHLPKHHDQKCDQRHGPRAACNSNLKAED